MRGRVHDLLGDLRGLTHVAADDSDLEENWLKEFEEEYEPLPTE